MGNYFQAQNIVLFTSNRPFDRAENIKAVFDAYDGPKEFIPVSPWHKCPELVSRKYALRVTDEFIGLSPGKAIMIGHGISGGKTFGLDQPHPYHSQKNARLLNYVITTSEAMIPLVAKQSGVPEDIVLPLGMPRTDVYVGKHKGDGGTGLAKKRAYLYVPTFRTKEETPMPDLDWDLIDSQLQDDEVFIVKPHPVTKRILRNCAYEHIVEVSSGAPSTPYLYDCDVVITDYSSIMFDAYLLGKPVVLFEKVEGYTKTRGMYLEYPWQYSSRYATDEESLLSLLRAADGLGETERSCIELTAGACDGHSSQRVCDLIRSMV